MAFACSCVKDNGSYGDPKVAPAISNIKDSTFKVYTHHDTLRITPTVANEDRYTFFWTIYSTNFNVFAGKVPKPDTLAKTKDLSYEVLLNPGQYILIFNVRDKETSVVSVITRNLSVSTLTMSGWYLLKDDNNTTDFDFIYPQGRIDNWMAYFNGGHSLQGKALKAVFVPSFKLSPTATDLFNTYAVISDEDAGIYRIDNGKQVMGFDSMFFSKPDVKKPQNIMQPMASNTLVLINNNKPYWMAKGGLFANSDISNYFISPVAGVGADPIFFDENSKSVVLYNSSGGSYIALNVNGTALKNMNAELVWIGAYPGLRSIALALFRKSDGTGLLTKINASLPYLEYWGSS
ncbi:MAG TPA: PKD-like family lipoprotein, partial [Pedobacter sp.]